jgi:hypothetical protein
MNIFWQSYRASSAADSAIDAQDARRSAQDTLLRTRQLEARCDRALLVCEALWTLLRDKMGVKEEELIDRVNQVDLSDGKLDGKVRRPAVDCPKCRRKVARRFSRCVYCGTAIELDTFSA